MQLQLELNRLRQEALAERVVAADKLQRCEEDRDRLSAQVASQALELSSAQAGRQEAEGQVSQLSLALAQARQQLSEEQERGMKYLPFKARAAELAAELAREKKAALHSATQLLARISALEQRAHRYKKLLLMVTTSAFVKLYKLKKSTRSLHLQISEMLVNILEGHLVATGVNAGMHMGAATATATATLSATAVASTNTAGASTSSGVTGSNIGVSSSGHGHAFSSGRSDPNVLLRKNLQRKKRLYLESVVKRTAGFVASAAPSGTPAPRGSAAAAALAAAATADPGVFRRGGMSIHELIISLEEELFKLRRPFEEVQGAAAHWRATGEAFFARALELRGATLNLQESLKASQAHIDALQSAAQQHQKERDTLQATNEALQADLSRARSGMTALKVQARTLVEASDVVGARKEQLAQLDSALASHQRQLKFVQSRFVDTVEALRTITAAMGPPIAHAQTMPTTQQQQQHISSMKDLLQRAEPPKAGPHFPPPLPSPPASAAAVGANGGHSASMAQLLASTFGVHFSASVSASASASSASDSPNGPSTAVSSTANLFAPTSSPPLAPSQAPVPGSSRSVSSAASAASLIPLVHSNPELYHSRSLQLFHETEQQSMALREFEKWQALQFVLENSKQPPSIAISSAAASNKNKKGSGGGDRDQLAESLSAMPEVSALQIHDNYASIELAATSEPGSGPSGAPSGGGIQGLNRSRAQEEEESKQSADLSTAGGRVRMVKGLHAGWATASSRSGSGSGSGPSSTYSSFAPKATTTEKAASDFSQTMLLASTRSLKNLSPAPASAATTAAGAFEAVYGAPAAAFASAEQMHSCSSAVSASLASMAHAPRVPSASQVAALRASIATELNMAPASSYVHPSSSSSSSSRSASARTMAGGMATARSGTAPHAHGTPPLPASSSSTLTQRGPRSRPRTQQQPQQQQHRAAATASASPKTKRIQAEQQARQQQPQQQLPPHFPPIFPRQPVAAIPLPTPAMLNNFLAHSTPQQQQLIYQHMLAQHWQQQQQQQAGLAAAASMPSE